MNKHIKKIGSFTKRNPILHRAIVFSYHFLLFEVYPFLFRKKKENLDVDLKDFVSLQKITSTYLNGVQVNDISDLKRYLDTLDVKYVDGGWSTYIFPHQSLSLIFKDLPYDVSKFGIKILHNLNGPLDVNYTFHQNNPSPGAATLRSTTPSALELLRIGCYLNNAQLSPRIIDLVCINFENRQATAFIVENVQSDVAVEKSDYDFFMADLDKELDNKVIDLSHGNRKFSTDFQPLSCNGNLLLSSDRKPLYVDFQSFRYIDETKAFQHWVDTHSDVVLFGPKRLTNKENYLYQFIPGVGNGKRSTIDRWLKLDELFKEADVSLANMYTFDIGCNTGLMSYYGLSRGVAWAFGWDRPNTANSARSLLNLLGASRSSVFECEIDENTDFSSNIISGHNFTVDNGCLFYFAVSNHIGFPSKVLDLPWKYLIYEGHSNQSIEESLSLISNSKWHLHYNLLASDYITDGDSPKRSLLIMERL
jgi:hypothetical protein